MFNITALVLCEEGGVYRAGYAYVQRDLCRATALEYGLGADDARAALDEVLQRLSLYPSDEILLYLDIDATLQDEPIEHLLLGERYSYVRTTKQIELDDQNRLFTKAFALHSLLTPIEHLGLQEQALASSALALILDTYSLPTLQFDIQPHIDDRLYLGNSVLEQLDIISADSSDSTLLKLLDRCQSGMGSRLFRDRLFNPILNKQELEQRYNLIELLSPHQAKLSTIIAKIGDIELLLHDRHNCGIELKRSLIAFIELMHFTDTYNLYKYDFQIEDIESLIVRLSHTDRVLTEQYQRLIYEAINDIAKIDVALSSAVVAKKHSLSRPMIIDCKTNFLQIIALRHVVVESLGSQYVSQDIVMGDIEHLDLPYPKSVMLDRDVRDGHDLRGVLLYGINSSGKSSLIKSVAHAVILAQSGFFIPASAMKFRLFKSIFTRIKSYDDIQSKRSSFVVEMRELNNILIRADDRSLVIADEISHGTETASSIAIVGSCIIRLLQQKSMFFLTTHLHQLLSIGRLQQLKGVSALHLNIEYDSTTNKLIYERILKAGAGRRLYGLEVASALKMDSAFLELAKQIRDDIEL